MAAAHLTAATRVKGVIRVKSCELEEELSVRVMLARLSWNAV